MQTRTRRLIKRGLQLRLTLAFAATAMVSTLFQLVLTSRSFGQLVKALPGSSDALVEHLPKVILTNLVLSLVWLLPTLVATGILITHRVAGPAHRLESYLRDVLDGRETGRCRLRRKDELQELCELINQVTARLPLEVADTTSCASTTTAAQAEAIPAPLPSGRSGQNSSETSTHAAQDALES